MVLAKKSCKCSESTTRKTYARFRSFQLDLGGDIGGILHFRLLRATACNNTRKLCHLERLSNVPSAPCTLHTHEPAVLHTARQGQGQRQTVTGDHAAVQFSALCVCHSLLDNFTQASQKVQLACQCRHNVGFQLPNQPNRSQKKQSVSSLTGKNGR